MFLGESNNMDPSKNIGKIKEQVEREHNSRRSYAKKWGRLIEADLTKFYHPDELNRELKRTLKYQDLCPFKYTGEGESYFVSKGMYESLCAVCRCGRPRSEAHILYCLQKEKDKYSDSIVRKESSITDQDRPSLPKTSNGSFGFASEKKPIYQKWENSMKYISPVNTMPGFRITAKPYNAIIIG